MKIALCVSACGLATQTQAYSHFLKAAHGTTSLEVDALADTPDYAAQCAEISRQCEAANQAAMDDHNRNLKALELCTPLTRERHACVTTPRALQFYPSMPV